MNIFSRSALGRLFKTNSQALPHRHIGTLVQYLNNGEINRREFVKTACMLGVSASSAMAFVGATGATAYAQSGTPKRGGVLRYGVGIQPFTDPALATWVEVSNIYRQSLEYLTKIDADGVIHPYLAQSWEANDDLTEWTFTLRNDVMWSNGDQFNVSDVEANFARWIAEDSKSVNKTLFAAVERFEAIDNQTFRLYLSRPILSIPEDLYQYPTAITHRSFGANNDKWVDNPIGTGPFNLTSYEVGTQATLVRRDDYWGEKAHLDGVNVIDYGNSDQPYISALASGQVDLLHRVTSSDMDLLKRLPNVELYQVSTASTPLMRVKQNVAPFDDIRIRKAMQLCVNREDMLLALRGLATVGQDHHTSPVHPEYYALPPLQQDIPKAQSLMREAGYSPDNPLEIEVAVGNTQGKYEQDLCAIFKNQAAPIGVNVKINVLPTSQYWPIWDKVPFGLTSWVHRSLGVTAHQLAYRSGAVWNETGFSNAQYDASLDRAMAILDPQERSQEMKNVESILQDEAVILQTLFLNLLSASNKKVKGFNMTPELFYDFNTIWLA